MPGVGIAGFKGGEWLSMIWLNVAKLFMVARFRGRKTLDRSQHDKPPERGSVRGPMLASVRIWRMPPGAAFLGVLVASQHGPAAAEDR